MQKTKTCSLCNWPPASERETTMMVHSPTLRSAAWCIAVVIVLGVLIAGCTESYDRDRDVPSDSGMTQPTGLDVVAADPGSLSASAQRGEQLFESRGCMGCHTVNGQGGNVGPDLSNEGNSGHSTQWLATQIRDPKSHDPQTAMPAFNNLSDQQVNDLVAYLESLKTGQAQGQSGQSGISAWPQAAAGRAAPVRTSNEVTAGGELWSRTCGQCHNLRPPSEYSDAQWAVAVHHMRVRVPLTGQEQREILEFLQASN
jgi:mono/diheme cytochrome c family protein